MVSQTDRNKFIYLVQHLPEIHVLTQVERKEKKRGLIALQILCAPIPGAPIQRV
jgi:hypothetical protein